MVAHIYKALDFDLKSFFNRMPENSCSLVKYTTMWHMLK